MRYAVVECIEDSSAVLRLSQELVTVPLSKLPKDAEAGSTLWISFITDTVELLPVKVLPAEDELNEDSGLILTRGPEAETQEARTVQHRQAS